MVRPSLKGKRILIVEDDRMLAEHLQAYLQEAGGEVKCALSKASGLDVAKKKNAIFDLALVDVYLPLRDRGTPLFGKGVELAAELKGVFPSMIIIGLSHYFDERVGKAISKNFAAFIQKRDLFMSEEKPSLKLLELIQSCLRKRKQNKPRVFIVHGHDDVAKYSLKNYIQNTLQLGEPTVLHEKPSSGRSLIEKFEGEAEEVDLVFVLLTPDDKACDVSSSDLEKLRARQNVIFEMGYFLGKLQRTTGRVILLNKGGIELPSDISGIVYIDISNGIEAAGEEIRREISNWSREHKRG